VSEKHIFVVETNAMHILLIDNYDSFTYNLVQLLRESGVQHRLTIVTNDIDPKSFPADIDKVLVSPGPGLPGESGSLMAHIAFFAGKTPILGICLGHQALALHFGADLRQLNHSMHGMDHMLLRTNVEDQLFDDVPDAFVCGRYHSWVVQPDQLPEFLLPTALDKFGNIMAFRHKSLDVRALQFHPESYITQHGQRMISNWLKM